MEPVNAEPANLGWREMPTEDGLYEYQGTLYGAKSDQATDCSSSCRVIVRRGDGLRMSLMGEDGQDYDFGRTAGGKWRGPVAPVRIPIEEARRAPEEGITPNE